MSRAIAEHGIKSLSFVAAQMSCPLLSGPSTMTVWTKEGTTNAFEEAQARGDHRLGSREVEIMLGQGGTTAEACRRIAVSEQTYYRWRKEYGGLKTDQARRMKDLEKENLRLRRAISDLTLDKLILQEAARGNLLTPRAAPALHRPVATRAPGVRATDMPGSGPASVDAAEGAVRGG